MAGSHEVVPRRYLPAVIPHVMVDGAAKAIASYAEVFGAQELFRIAHPDGRIVHAELSVYGSVLMIGDAEPPFAAPSEGPTVGLHVYVDDVDPIAERAAAAGYEVLQPPRDQFYGDRTAMLKDPFGHIWVFLAHREDLEPAEIAARGNALLNPAR